MIRIVYFIIAFEIIAKGKLNLVGFSEVAIGIIGINLWLKFNEASRDFPKWVQC